MANSIEAVLFPSLSPKPNLHFPPKRIQELNPSPRPNLSLGFDSRRKGRCRGRIREVKQKEEEDAFGISERSELEAEILDFMERSKNPKSFPTKAELIAAGRRDLDEAIAEKGGWLAFGWDSEAAKEDQEILPSGKSMERDGGEETGILGILSRLARERSLSFGGGSQGKDFNEAVSSAVGGIERSNEASTSYFGEDPIHQFRHVHYQKGTAGDFPGKNSAPDMWRMWSLHRAGNPISKFEAAEIVPDEGKMNSDINFLSNDSVDEDMNKEGQTASNIGERRPHQSCDAKASAQNPLRARLQHLDSELSNALHLLRSGTTGDISHKGQNRTSKDLCRLPDVWEFKETETIKANDELRSTRAKLAVLEGKMALQIIEGQRITADNKRRLDAARRALEQLRYVSILWPNFASEVQLVGSFDGWTSQWKMNRLDTGIFSLQLRLYPGRYEIKFIVDGAWRIDPLRPVVHSNGHKNNLLIVS